MNKLPIQFLKGCPCMVVSLCSLCVDSGFDRRDGTELSMGHIFPWGVLTDTTLMGGRTGDGGSRPGTRIKPVFLLCSMTYQWWGQVFKCWSRNLDVWVLAGSILSVHSLLSQQWQFCPVWSRAGARRAGVGA